MTPSNANKQGVRYRYYVSAPVLQGRREAAGSVPRVPAPNLEELVIATVRANTEPPNASSWVGPLRRELVERFVQRVELRPNAVRLELLPASEDDNEPHATSVRTVTVRWSPPPGRLRREVIAAAGKSAEAAEADALRYARDVARGHRQGAEVVRRAVREPGRELRNHRLAEGLRRALRTLDIAAGVSGARGDHCGRRGPPS